MGTRGPRMNAQIYAEASEWFAEFRDREPDAAARREFDRWLRASPEHLAAYLEIAALWNEAGTLDRQGRWSAERLIAEARADQDNVVSLPTLPAASSAAAAVRLNVKRMPATATVGLFSLVVLVLAGLWLLESKGAKVYDTTIGEQRSVTLPDGSTVDLNSNSRIEMRYSERGRDIELLEGQALFNVARDPARPFVVSSGTTRVRAVGTQFDVYRKPSGTMVTVVEGRVSVLGGVRDISSTRGSAGAAAPAHTAPAAEVLLTAGGQVLVTDATIQRAARPNISSAVAWRQRQLVFDSASLAEVAEEFNRYNTRQLVIRDAGLRSFHISGVFSSTDPASLIRFLRERPEVQVTETASEILVTKSSPAR
jgi:transmembrane sensor